MIHRPEILAPAGSIEALEAAVRCGADAVYLGQKSFSARANSRNFGPEELKAAVSYAHRFGVKIHQALNTVVFDSEIPALLECIRTACEAGVDALIVQDWGVASIVRQTAPKMPLHASTQMAIHSPAGVKTAERLGFSRVVLARELSREEIAAIRRSTSLELETFVHGAHCMSMSGQCYMSAVFGGKSGNRGQCAQPCRLPFVAGCPEMPKAGEHVLSLKDMSLVSRLTELAEMGVDSFKIEGRMKRPEYVAAAVTACRKALEGEEPDLDTLQAVFSRSGFTSGYFDSAVNREMFGFRRKEDVAAAAPVLKNLAGWYHKDVQRVPVSMEFVMREKEPVRLTLSDGLHSVSVEGEMPRPAVSAPADEALARKFLSKLGGTPYFLQEFHAVLDPGLTMSSSAFNAIRREAVAKLDAMREAQSIPFFRDALPDLSVEQNYTSSPQKWGKFDGISQIPSNYREFFDKILLSVKELEGNLSRFSGWEDHLIAVLPRFLFDTEEDFVIRLNILREAGIGTLLCENAAHLELARRCGMKAAGGPWLNLTNSYSLHAAENLGLDSAICSIEVKLDFARTLRHSRPLGALVYGHIPLMSLRNCPVKAQIGCEKCRRRGFVTDRRGISFPVRCDADRSVSFLYNAVPLVLSDRQREISCFDFWLFDFTVETSDQVREILELYRTESHPSGEYTRGLYYRGID
ncbi:MAG: peptidase U32 family protein [Candidatus Merdivicinus sp.]|jgi:putative protease